MAKLSWTVNSLFFFNREFRREDNGDVRQSEEKWKFPVNIGGGYMSDFYVNGEIPN